MRRSRGMVRAVLRHPAIWVEAMRAWMAMAPVAWWRRAPFVPIAHDPYLSWREATAYPIAGGVVDGADLVDYLRWRRGQRGLN